MLTESQPNGNAYWDLAVLLRLWKIFSAALHFIVHGSGRLWDQDLLLQCLLLWEYSVQHSFWQCFAWFLVMPFWLLSSQVCLSHSKLAAEIFSSPASIKNFLCRLLSILAYQLAFSIFLFSAWTVCRFSAVIRSVFCSKQGKDRSGDLHFHWVQTQNA